MLEQRSSKNAKDREVNKTQKVARTKNADREIVKTQENKKMNKNDEKFINIQLFADDEKSSEPEKSDTDTKSTTNETQQTPPVIKTSNEKVVSKDLFDKTANELSQLKKELKELKDVGKSTEQKTQDALAELDQAKKQKQEELDNLTIKLNKANSIATLSDIKSKINLSDKDTEFDGLIDELVMLDGDKTSKRIISFKGLLEKVYNKGFEQAKQGGWNSMSNIKANNSSGKTKSGFAEYQEKINKTINNEKIDFNKK